MDLNIKGMIHLDFRRFESVEKLIEFVRNDENFDNLANICFDEREEVVIKYENLYEKEDEIWIVDNYLVAKKSKGSNQIRINPDLARFLLEKSINYVDKRREEEKKDFIENLNVDSILDRISKIGFENITEEEKEFLKNNG
jgi:hypothetical protein